MKKCQLCGEDSPNDAATCPNDGEATWGEQQSDEPEKPEAPKRRSRR